MSGPLGSSQWMYASGYELEQSLKYNDDTGDSLTRTLTTAGNRKTWTFSAWIKRGVGGFEDVFKAYVSVSNYDAIQFDSDGSLRLFGHPDVTNYNVDTTAVFRDSSAWYHFVVVLDTTESTASNRVKIYANGVLQAVSGSYPGLDGSLNFNNTVEHQLAPSNFDGYLAEVNFIEGTALTPSSFGETGTYGEWKPKEYTGSHGTNGFYLPFKNDYTVEGFSAVTYKGSATRHYIGGVGFSPDLVWTKSISTAGKQNIIVDKVRGGSKNVMSDSDEAENSNANRKLTLGAADGYVIDSNSGHLNESDKTYASWNWKMGGLADAKVITGVSGGVTTTSEKKFGTASLSLQGGSNSRHYKIVDHPDFDFGTGDFTIELWIHQQSNPSAYDGIISFADSYQTSKGFGIGYNSSAHIYFTSHLGDAVSVVAHDAALSNSTWHHIAVSRSSGTTRLFINGTQEASATDNNDYQTTPNGGYGIALGRYYPNSDEKYFHGEFDEIRISNNARYTGNFSVATQAYGTDANTVLLMHCDGTHTGTLFPDSSSAVENTDGTITSYVSASTTYGQSIVKYTGVAGVSDATKVGHGLDSAPEMIILKVLGAAEYWPVWHHEMHADGAFDRKIYLNDNGGVSGTDQRRVTSVSSTTFGLPEGASTGGYSEANQIGEEHIAYVFHSVTGYSKFGSYTGNGNATGPTVTTGFKPAFVMIKVTDRTDGGNGGWFFYDSTRSVSNVRDDVLQANSTAAQISNDSNLAIDFLDTGFQLKASYDEINVNNGKYIYMAFADNREYAYWLDQSGNNNDFTSNSLTESGISVDTPSNNFCTFNPLHAGDKGGLIGAISEGNLKHYLSGSGTALTMGTMAPTTGKWYCEFTMGDPSGAGSDRSAVGIGDVYSVDVDAYGNDKKTVMVSTSSDNRVWLTDNVESDNAFPSRSNGDIIQFAWDMDASKFWIGLNNTWYTSNGTKIASSDVPAGNNPTVTDTGMTSVSPMNRWGAGSSITQTHYLNCGQDSSFSGYKIAQGNTDSNGIGDFYYEPPSGHLALCTSNLPDATVTPSEHFNTVLYTGNGSQRNITGVGFQPDWVFLKVRNATGSPVVFDSVRGATKRLRINNDSQETTSSAGLNAFISDGFSIGNDYGNNNNETYVAWNWKANGSGGTSHTQGTITSTVSVNTDAKFSIGTYTGNGTNPATIGHGLGVVPDFIVVKKRDTSDDNWTVYHTGLHSSEPEDYFIKINETAAASDNHTTWNDTAPTATLFTTQNDSRNNANGAKYVFYAFKSVDGYSKFGSYTGNGNANGTFVYTGFRPAWVMMKDIVNANSWVIIDSERDTYNQSLKRLYADSTEAEYTDTDDTIIDIVSNGFKHRYAGGNANQSDDKVIYLAFAETPFKYSNAR